MWMRKQMVRIVRIPPVTILDSLVRQVIEFAYLKTE